jgi:hypothetical protein
MFSGRSMWLAKLGLLSSVSAVEVLGAPILALLLSILCIFFIDLFLSLLFSELCGSGWTNCANESPCF